MACRAGQSILGCDRRGARSLKGRCLAAARAFSRAIGTGEQPMSTTRFLGGSAYVALALVLGACALSEPKPAAPTIASQWNQSLLDAVKATSSTDVVTARALAVLNIAVYDAWAVHDRVATPVHLDAKLRRAPASDADKEVAVSFAAYRVLVDLFPSQREAFGKRMAILKLDANDAGENPATPSGIGNVAAKATLTLAHSDGSNQLGDKRPGAYSDYTDYRPPNPPGKMIDWRLFQPPAGADGRARNFGVAQWRFVKPFALASGAELRPTAAPIQRGN